MERQPLAAWLDAGDAPLDDEPDDEETAPRRRRMRLLLLAALPWAVLGGVLVGAGGDGDEPSPAAGEEAAGDGDAALGPDDRPIEAGAGQGPDDRPVATPSHEGAPGTATPDVAGSGAGVPPAAGAGAVLAVRETATEHAGEEARRYVDLAVAEAAETHGAVTVVRVLTVVLEGDGRAWTDAAVERYAVAVDADGRALGAPWPVPNPPAADPELDWERIEDDGILTAVGAALERHGREPDDELTLERAEQAPGLLRAGFGDEEVWLTDADPPRLLGAPPTTADERTAEEGTAR